MLSSAIVLERWSSETVVDFCAENGVFLPYFQAQQISERNPLPPLGWINSDDQEPLVCWSSAHFDRVTQTALKNSESMPEIEQDVDHSTLLELIDDLARAAIDAESRCLR